MPGIHIDEPREQIGMREGLSLGEAHARLLRDGPNEIPSADEHNLWTVVREAVADPMVALLIAAATAHLILGEVRDSLVLLLAVAAVIGISIRQEWKAGRALQALRDLSAPMATVKRDGTAIRVPAVEVVIGDLVILEPGDRVPADAQLYSAFDLHLDESLLTGESVPVMRNAEEKVFSGSLVVRGHAEAEVFATGTQSELGRLGKSLAGVRRIANPTEKALQMRVRRMAYGAMAICALFATLHIYRGASWIQATLAALSLAIAMIPEEFPVVNRIFLVMGAWRLAAANVLTRNLSGLQSLSHASVLCVDKTGTLTLNQLSVQEVVAIAGTQNEVLLAAALASDGDSLDPLDAAILRHDWVRAQLPKLPEPEASPTVLMAMKRIYSQNGNRSVYMKGAPEVIAQECEMTAPQRHAWETAVTRLALGGLKTLGIAKSEAYAPGEKLTPVGIIGLIDPLRPEVPASVARAYRAGLRVLIFTGDHPATAKTIAEWAGIKVDRSLTGSETETLADIELQAAVKGHTLFSRVTPSQKLRLVECLKQLGESVAMTGDGVNDAPALKAADVGIAMGKRGTDVARETADLILVNDDFTSIVNATATSRAIRWKLERAIRFIVAVHVPIATLAILPFLLNWPLVLLPLHIVLLELVIDPACSVVFEAEPVDEDVMLVPPARFAKSLFSKATLLTGFLEGIAACVAVAGIFSWSYVWFGDAADSRTLAFSTLLLADIALIWLNRSSRAVILRTMSRPNPLLWGMSALVVGLLALVTQVPWLWKLLRLGRLHLLDYGAVAAAVVLMVTVVELAKMMGRRFLSARLTNV